MSDSPQSRSSGHRQPAETQPGSPPSVAVPPPKSLKPSSGLNEPGSVTPHFRSRPWVWVLAGLTLTGVLTTGFVRLLTKPPARFPLLVLIDTDYRYPLPPNSWGTEDRQRFREFANLSGSPIQVLEPGDGVEPVNLFGQIQAAWESMENSFENRPEVVGVYVSLHGHVDSLGAPVLIPSHSSLNSPTDWISISGLLDCLESCRHSARKGNWSGSFSSEIVLFLDAARSPVAGDLGLTHRGFATAVRQTLEKRSSPGISVILSADDSQRSNGGCESGGSFFARQLLQGLLGLADDPHGHRGSQSSAESTTAGGDGSLQVDLRELSLFLERSVSEQSWEFRGLPQKPSLLGASVETAKSMRLTHVNSGTTLRRVWSQQSRPECPDWPDHLRHNLFEAWQSLEQACRWTAADSSNTPEPVITPAQLSDLRARLLWAELALEGGPALQPLVGPLLEECLAALLREQHARPVAFSGEPAIAMGVELAISARPASTDAGINPAAEARETLRNLAKSADRAWGTAVTASGPGPRFDPRIHQAFQERLTALDELRRPLEDELFLVLAKQERGPIRGVDSSGPPLTGGPSPLWARGGDLSKSYDELAVHRDLFVRGRAATEATLALGPLYARWSDSLPGGIPTFAGAGVTALDSRLLELWKESWNLRMTLGGSAPGTDTASVERLRIFLSDLGAPGQATAKVPTDLWTELTRLILGLISVDRGEGSPEESWDEKRQRSAMLQLLLESGFPCDECALGLRQKVWDRWKTLRTELLKHKLPGTQGRSASVSPLPVRSTSGELIDRQLQRLVSEEKSAIDKDLQARVEALRWRLPKHGLLQVDSLCLESLREASWQRLRTLSEREVKDCWPTSQGEAAGFERLEPVWNQMTRLKPGLDHDDDAESSHIVISQDREKLLRAESLLARQLRLRGSALRSLPPGFSQDWTFELEPESTLPAGPSAVLGISLLSGGNMVLGEKVGSPTPAGTASQRDSLSVAGTWVEVPVAHLDYRGWHREYPVSLQPSEWTVSRWTRPTEAQPTVQVRLGTGPREDLVLVLDSSASMATAEIRPQAEGPSTRFEAARGALTTVLEGFTNDDQIRVGVWLIGHRVAWSRKEPGRLLRQQEYTGGIPDELRPAADVESILPLGRFDSAALELVDRRLESVRPWGETPLYLAMLRAVEEQARGGSTAVRQVVAITDGFNYQFNPGPEENVSRARLIDAARQSRVKLNVIHVAVDARDRNRAEAEYQELVDATGGQYIPVRESGDLLATLRGLLQLRKFTVRDGQTGIEQSSSLGVPLAIEREEQARIEISVQDQGRTIRLGETQLTSDEAVELVLDPATRTARSAVYAGRNPVLVNIVAAQPTDPELQLAVHIPQRDRDEVEFLFSLRSPSGRIVDRPQAIWIEITPQDPQGTGVGAVTAGPTHVFQEVQYLARTPNPVFRVSCENWPAAATQAQVEIWLGTAPGDFDLIEPDSSTPGTPAPGDRIVWTETLDPQGRPSRFVRPAQRLPAAIKRVFVKDLGQVRHEFLFPAEFDPPVQLRVSDSGLWKQVAARLPKPVEIAIPRTVDNLRPLPKP